jgi:hypothetical protein
MRKLGYAVVVGVTLIAAGPLVSSPPPPEFDLTVFGPAATDIVVTDPDGRVLESWRGELRPGDIVGLGPARLTPVNALPWEYLRLRTERALSAMYREWDSSRYARRSSDPTSSISWRWDWEVAAEYAPLPGFLWPTTTDEAETELRLVLFLRKEDTTGVGVVWMPADAPGNRIEIGYRSGADWRTREKKNADFSTSMAWVEAGRVVALRHIIPRSANFGSERMTPVAGTLKEFKDEVMRLPAPKVQADAVKQPGAGGSLRTWADFVTLSVPALTTRQGTHP